MLSVDASTVGNLDLDLIDNSNTILDDLNKNKFEIVFLAGQDNLDFKKKDEFIIYQGAMVIEVLKSQTLFYQVQLLQSNQVIILI